jgi:hypothetical protein
MHLSAQVPQYRIDEPCWSIRLDRGFAAQRWDLLVHPDFTVGACERRRHRILDCQGLSTGARVDFLRGLDLGPGSNIH